jgi:hypothetical protein
MNYVQRGGKFYTECCTGRERNGIARSKAGDWILRETARGMETHTVN